MKNRLFAIASLSAASLMPAAETAFAEAICGIDPDRVGVRYTVTERHDGDESSYHIRVWRRGNQVAYVHEEKELTEIWDLVRDGRQKLIRYFDSYQRAIEYQPEDVESGAGQDAWSGRYQVIADSELDSMTLEGSGGDDCELVQVLRHADGARQTTVHWRPAWKIAEEIRNEQGDRTVTWRVDDLFTDADRVDDEFTRRHRYHTIDFVDIGDNESDPFLQKMIHLGFIEHKDH